MIMLVLIHHSYDCICEVPPPLLNQGFLGFSEGKESTFNAGNLDLIPGVGKMENGMAAHSSVLAWRILWTEEPGGLQSMGSQRVGHN